MNKPNDMHPSTWPRYIRAFAQANINPQFGTKANGQRGSRLLQLIGTAPASAGYHEAEGDYSSNGKLVKAFTYKLNGKDHIYGAALDLRTIDLTTRQVEDLWIALMKNGFAAWWRHTGSFSNNQHIHMVDQGVHMKRVLRNQSHSFYRKKNGLMSDRVVSFLVSNLDTTTENYCRSLFLKSNPSTGETFLGDEDNMVQSDCICSVSFDENSDGVTFPE